MSTLLVTHPAGLSHATPAGHPERADRLRVLDRIFEQEKFSHLVRDLAPRGEREDIIRVHPGDFVDAMGEAVPQEGLVRIDSDTILSPGSWEAALRAVGGACFAVDEVMEGKVSNAFVAMRPPGHHCETRKPMGFCLMNQVAIAARHAQAKYGLQRVAIVDFDVHHGNGTQEIFWADDSVLYCSTHEMPLYPGTGAQGETGAVNTIVNAPLRSGDDGTVFKEAMETRILPRITSFAPDLILISAGFDAHVRDPLASLRLVDTDFGWITRRLMEIADKKCEGRVVSLLEGGYDLEGLATSAAAHVTALMHG
ncbi:acetoin utilization deacetylase AcuC-like enzyme [Xanthobacter flavus]|uniref:Acetoin utilization deacetylase AcuC-like enzyme n=1 Tax=Xanthobacter flavus TaxID=281 RepID=A0A9W6CSE8_XANFL|nr:histone deacetylase family protein [Xanthobacter flavus]MDR6334283.1 acetoin utilization deacetylase AcuC-like enzyme [Xanthobacter flavus]GLI23003.1 acetoin utilization protein [Xanthobacter flavus]